MRRSNKTDVSDRQIFDDWSLLVHPHKAVIRQDPFRVWMLVVDGNLWTSHPEHHGGPEGDGEEADCVIEGPKYSMTESQ